MKKIILAISITIMCTNISFACDNEIKDLGIISNKIEVTIDTLVRCHKTNNNDLIMDINSNKVNLSYISKSLARQYDKSKDNIKKRDMSKAFCVISLYNLALDDCDLYINNNDVGFIKEAVNSKELADVMLETLK